MNIPSKKCLLRLAMISAFLPSLLVAQEIKPSAFQVCEKASELPPSDSHSYVARAQLRLEHRVPEAKEIRARLLKHKAADCPRSTPKRSE